MTITKNSFLNALIYFIIGFAVSFFIYLKFFSIEIIKEIEKKETIEPVKTKHHHFIIPDSDFDSNGCIDEKKNDSLINRFLKKINSKFSDSFSTFIPDYISVNYDNSLIYSVIKTPPLDLVAIYFDSGERFSLDMVFTYDEISNKITNTKNVYYFWRTPNMTKKFEPYVKTALRYNVDKDSIINDELNQPRCPSNALMLTEKDIENL